MRAWCACVAVAKRPAAHRAGARGHGGHGPRAPGAAHDGPGAAGRCASRSPWLSPWLLPAGQNLLCTTSAWHEKGHRSSSGARRRPPVHAWRCRAPRAPTTQVTGQVPGAFTAAGYAPQFTGAPPPTAPPPQSYVPQFTGAGYTPQMTGEAHATRGRPPPSHKAHSLFRLPQASPASPAGCLLLFCRFGSPGGHGVPPGDRRGHPTVPGGLPAA